MLKRQYFCCAKVFKDFAGNTYGLHDFVFDTTSFLPYKNKDLLDFCRNHTVSVSEASSKPENCIILTLTRL